MSFSCAACGYRQCGGQGRRRRAAQGLPGYIEVRGRGRFLLKSDVLNPGAGPGARPRHVRFVTVWKSTELDLGIDVLSCWHVER